MDKQQITTKCLAILQTMATEADTRARQYGTKGDFDSKDAQSAYKLADRLHQVIDRLTRQAYLAALEQLTLLSDIPLIRLGIPGVDVIILTMDMEDLAKPQVGDGVTVCYASDRYAGTITKVSETGAKIWVVADKATNTKQWPEQDYTFERNPDGQVWIGRRGMNGVYRVQGGSAQITVGPRSQYQAPEV